MPKHLPSIFQINTMKKLIILISFSFIGKLSHAQTIFLNKGEVEYEVRTSIKKTMGNSDWIKMLGDRVPDVKISYYTLLFNCLLYTSPSPRD